MKSGEKRPQGVYIIPTRYGFLYGFCIFILLALATVFSNQECLLLTALLVSAGVICMHQTHSNIAGLSIEQIDTQSGFAKDKTLWKVRFKNTNSTSSFSIAIFDEVFDIPPGDSFNANISLTFRKRGFYKLDRLKISTTYPFGLFYSWKWIPTDSSYFVYPALGSPGAFMVNLQNQISELESREDFIGHKEYVVGESAHHIDWKAHARSQKLLIKLFESNHIAASIFEWSQIPSRETEEKLSLLTRAIYECHHTQTSFGMVLPGAIVPIGSGNQHFENCLKYLATFDERKNEKVA